MSGIYFHIPFCAQACHYCDFHFSTQLSLMDELIQMMGKELSFRLKNEKKSAIKTIYFGGGTPSILQKDHLELIFRILKNNIPLEDVQEITLEANPEDISDEKLAYWSQLGINRISLGVQSFDDEALHHSHRLHTSEKAVEALSKLKQSEIRNFSVDLIFCLLPLKNDRILLDLAQLLEFRPPHISVYGLTIEPKTVYGKWEKTKKIIPSGEDQFAEEFLYIHNKLQLEGYDHYEISNYSLPGFESLHNQSYWMQQPYLGIGPGAHGYTGEIRYQNIANNAIYIKQMVKGPYAEITREKLSAIDLLNEYVLTRLRTKHGLSKVFIQHKVSKLKYQEFLNLFYAWQLKKWILKDEENIILTPEGMLLADELALQLFISE